jgi:hypothetical protein
MKRAASVKSIMSEQHDKKQSGWKHQQTPKGWHFPQQKEQHGE